MYKLAETIPFNHKKNDILTVGELLIDMISQDYDDDFEGDVYQRYFGGSSANIAMNTNKLGVNSIVVSAVGNDGLGLFLKNQLQKSGVDTSYIQTVDHATSLVLLTKSKTSPKPIFYRGADYHLQYNTKLSQAIKDSKILHFSSWPISRMPARKTIEKCIEEARKNDLLIGFDPNYHPMLWQSGENGVDYVKSLIQKVDIIKPSEDDAERIFGKGKVIDHIDKFLSLGAKLVIMTLGEDGAIVSNGNEFIEFESYATKVVDSTGAGDAFWSGFYTALVKQYTLEESLKLGFAVSAYKLREVGAVIDLPELEKIKEIYKL